MQGRKEIFQVHLRNITLEGGLPKKNKKSTSTTKDGKKKDGTLFDDTVFQTNGTENNNDDDDETSDTNDEDQEQVDPVAEVFASRLAGLTPGFAGADIANLVNEAAIVAARRKGESVSLADFEKATDRIIGGLESNKLMSEQERKIVAHHEAGHAMALAG